MSSRDEHKTVTTPQLSSLIVRPPTTDIGEDSGETRRDHHSRSERYPGESASTSAVRKRDTDRRHNHELDRSRSRDASSWRSAGRFRGFSPHRGRERGGDRLFHRGPARLDIVGVHRGEPASRSNLPRGGNWYCPDPSCRHLNFARREICQACKRSRQLSPRRRGYPPLPEPLPRRFRSPPPLLGRGFRSPSPVFFRDTPREFGDDILPPPPRHDDDRFYDHYLRRDRPDYLYDHYRETRFGFERPTPLSPPPSDWGYR